MLKEFLFSLAVLPFIYLSKLGAYTDSCYLLAYMPFSFGRGLRFAFYKKTLEYVGTGTTFHFGSLVTSRSAVIGHNVRIGPFCTLGNCKLGDNILLAQYVHILSGRHQHGSKGANEYHNSGGTIDTITIGSDVWIGAACVIMANVGSNCVVGAGSIVVKPLESRTVSAGNPAKEIRRATINDNKN